MPILFTGGRFLDLSQDRLVGGREVLVDGPRIVEVSDSPIRCEGATRIDLGGRTLMPGLVDCHVHVVASGLSPAALAALPSSLAALRAAPIMRDMLMRGFTTVRDAGGADAGLVQAVAEGLVDGPRLVISGKALSQTGGHGDFRGRSDDRPGIFSERVGALGRLADGIDAVRLAAREEIKAGAKFIKVLANGGITSPNDPIHALGYSRPELEAIVDEARNAGLYVAAHVYTDAAIRRAVECGVHSLEHCSLIEAPTATLAACAGCIAVPTLSVVDALAIEGAQLGLDAAMIAKIKRIREAGLNSLETMHKARLPMAFGTDLLGDLHRHQAREFEIRAQVLSSTDILASATLVGAKLCGLENEIGIIAPGAFADMLVVDGDPLQDIAVLADRQRILAIMREGRFVKNGL